MSIAQIETTKTQDAIGEKLGDYEVLSCLGPDLLGHTYLAFHPFLEKLYLVRLLPFSVDEEVFKRMKAEVGLYDQIDHPHIASIHNVGIEKDQLLIATEIGKKGQKLFPLSQWLASETSEEQITQIASQVAGALDYLHGLNIEDAPLSYGLLNLDSVFICQAEEQLEVKLIDFGLERILRKENVISRCYEAFLEKMAQEESFEKILNIHSFLPPESVHLQERYGVEADRYAFGVLVYYLLMKRFPQGYFPFPSSKGWKQLWDRVIKECLAFDPKNRKNGLLSLLEEKPHKASLGEKLVSSYKPSLISGAEVEPLLTDMVVIEGGEFYQGSDQGARDEVPMHKVELSSFAMDIHPVTNEQFVRFLTFLGGEKEESNFDVIRLRSSRIQRQKGKLLIESGYSKHPVVGVTWYGAAAYANWVDRQLPTEAQWETAARGEGEAQYPNGDKIERSSANFFSTDTTSVMSYPSNALGLFDMAGNVYEWCADWYDYAYYEIAAQEPFNPQGPIQGTYRVLRGGCWKSLKEDIRVSHRHRNNPGAFNGTYGFRCCTKVSS